MLSFGESKPDILQRSIVEICHAEIESDGLDFDADSIEISEIREGHKYQGHWKRQYLTHPAHFNMVGKGVTFYRMKSLQFTD